MYVEGEVYFLFVWLFFVSPLWWPSLEWQKHNSFALRVHSCMWDSLAIKSSWCYSHQRFIFYKCHVKMLGMFRSLLEMYTLKMSCQLQCDSKMFPLGCSKYISQTSSRCLIFKMCVNLICLICLYRIIKNVKLLLLFFVNVLEVCIVPQQGSLTVLSHIIILYYIIKMKNIFTHL